MLADRRTTYRFLMCVQAKRRVCQAYQKSCTCSSFPLVVFSLGLHAAPPSVVIVNKSPNFNVQLKMSVEFRTTVLKGWCWCWPGQKRPISTTPSTDWFWAHRTLLSSLVCKLLKTSSPNNSIYQFVILKRAATGFVEWVPFRMRSWSHIKGHWSWKGKWEVERKL